MTYEFNLHIEKVHRVTVASNKPLHEVVADVMEAYKNDRLKLDDGDFINAELWDDDGNEVAELDAWGREWRIEEE